MRAGGTPDRRERICIWRNPRAGRGEAASLTEQLGTEATGRGHEVRVLPSDSVEACRAAIDEAMAIGVDRLVVVGGDGTVHQAIQAAARTPVVVGVVPAGSGNDLAEALGLATTPATAIDVALGPSSPIDLLRIGDRYGVTVATLGFSVSVNRRANGLRWPGGRARYTAAALRELVGLRRYPITLDLDGRRLDLTPNVLAVANTSFFGGGMRIAPDARPDDGRLDVVVVGPASRVALLRLLPRVRSGHHVDHAAVQVHRASRAVIDAEQPQEIWADGEIIGTTPAEIELVPAALRVAGVRDGEPSAHLPGP